MDVEVVGRLLSTLPADDDHPYRTGPWRPQTTEWRADDLEVVEGEVPTDLDGVYLRNTENPLHPSMKSYHPFDGDGMIHVVGFRDGKAFYRNRFVRTDGLAEEAAAGRALWAGLAEPPSLTVPSHGWGARGGMKDASSTDVVVHRGTALTSFYQCGDLYRLDPESAETLGKETWHGRFPFEWGVSAHPKVDDRTGEMLFFNYGKEAPYLHYGVVDEHNELAHYIDVPLPGPRLPHDMAFTENYAILNDFPLFWDPELLAQGAHVARFHPDLPTRFAVIPRRGATSDIRWFEAESTYVLHFVNAYEDGDEIVVDGFFQGDPAPADNGMGNEWQRAFRFLALDRMQSRLHRWRLDLRTGLVREEPLSDSVTEFGMVNAAVAGTRHRYTYAASGKPSWFLFDGLVKHDVLTGSEERHSYGDGVYGSETAMAPRVGGTAEDDGYLVTLTTDMNADASYAVVLRRGPGRRRTGVPAPAARADLQRHALDVGARRGAAPVADRRHRGRGRRPLTAPATLVECPLSDGPARRGEVGTRRVGRGEVGTRRVGRGEVGTRREVLGWSGDERTRGRGPAADLRGDADPALLRLAVEAARVARLPAALPDAVPRPSAPAGPGAPRPHLRRDRHPQRAARLLGPAARPSDACRCGAAAPLLVDRGRLPRRRPVRRVADPGPRRGGVLPARHRP